MQGLLQPTLQSPLRGPAAPLWRAFSAATLSSDMVDMVRYGYERVLADGGGGGAGRIQGFKADGQGPFQGWEH